ncbi:hypothetical protein ACFQ0M_00505 [Kitasatospora aburaviensis]
MVPGLYGYTSATKWLVDLEVTTFAARDPYWVQRGWDRTGEVRTASRIDVPAAFARVQAGDVTVAGTAWATHRGVAAVEVRVDGGPWQEAALAADAGPDMWRQWHHTWRSATPARTAWRSAPPTPPEPSRTRPADRPSPPVRPAGTAPSSPSTEPPSTEPPSTEPPAPQRPAAACTTPPSPEERTNR